MLQHSQGASLTGKVQSSHLEGYYYCEPMSKGKLVIYLLGFPLTLVLRWICNRDITESFPTFKHTVSCTKTPCEIWRYLESILLVHMWLPERNAYTYVIFLIWSTELELIGFSPIYIYITSLSQPSCKLMYGVTTYKT